MEVRAINKLTKKGVNNSLCPVAEEFNMTEQPTEEELDILNITLYIKDKFSISGQAYHEIKWPEFLSKCHDTTS